MKNEQKALTPQEFISLYQSNPKPLTNEQKAKQIAENNRMNYYEGEPGWGCNVSSSEDECYESALEAMKWKDEQELQFLQSLKFHATYYIFDKINERIKLLKKQ